MLCISHEVHLNPCPFKYSWLTEMFTAVQQFRTVHCAGCADVAMLIISAKQTDRVNANLLVTVAPFFDVNLALDNAPQLSRRTSTVAFFVHCGVLSLASRRCH
jgi:hypothetical protein